MAMSLLLIVLFICILPFRNCTNVNFTIPIIHRNSPLSPYFDPNSTVLDFLESDLARLESLDNYNPSKSSGVSFNAHTRYFSGAYLMEIRIGSGNESRHVFFDTATDITWIQCHPCTDCNFKKVPPFNALSSTTYKPLTCKHSVCTKDKRLGCSSGNSCGFHILYSDGGNVQGDMALEDIRILTATRDGYHEMSNFTFGCAHMERTKLAALDGVGVVGLGLGPLSLLSQLSINKFSYCIPPVPDEDADGYQHVAFGHMAINPGQRTPLLPDSEFFYIGLEGISFQSIRLPLMFPSPEGYFKMKLDTGTTGIWLHPHAYVPLSMAITNEIKLERFPSDSRIPESCYFGTLEDVQHLKITLHFHSGVNIELSKWSIFHKVKNSVCLIIGPSQSEHSVLGMYGQINHNVGYDLAKQEVSFFPTDCNII